MTILKDLLALRQPAETRIEEVVQLDERRGPGDMAELIEKWQDKNKIYSFEGSRGERNFEKLVRVLGYSDMSAFFEDNPGVFESMIEWLGSMRNPEWLEAMKEDIGGDDDNDDDNDDDR